MIQNFLKLNQDKTEAILISTSNILKKKLKHLQLSIPGYFTTTSAEVRNLGVIFDFTLSFESHMKNITRTSFFHLKSISKLRPSLNSSAAETLIHAFITSRLDYCNALFLGKNPK